MWGTRRGRSHAWVYLYSGYTQCVTNLFAHSDAQLTQIGTIRVDTILLMWAVAENVKFRVCSSSRFSNGAHAGAFIESSIQLKSQFFERRIFPSCFVPVQPFPFFFLFFSFRAAADLRVCENRDLFANNFACHVSLNRHHVQQRRDNTNKQEACWRNASTRHYGF